jgi:NitT/TauT family transport system substrate-binding protein
MAMTRRAWLASGLAATALGTTGGGAAAAEPIKFMTLAGHYYMTPMFAQEEDLFAKHGLVVQVGIATAPPTLLPAVVSGTLPIGVTSSIQLAMSHEAGLDIVAVAGASLQARSRTTTAIVASKTAHIHTAADLVGKRVVVPGLNGSYHVMFLKYLRDAGIDPARVQILEGGFGLMADMVKGGSADAALATEPFLTRMLDAGIGNRIEYFIIQRDYQFDSLFISTRSWCARHPAELAGIRASLHDAVAMMQAQPALSQAVEAKYLKLPPEMLATLGAPDYRVDVTPGDLQVWADLGLELGLISKPFDVKELIA